MESVPDDSISHYSNEFENSATNQQKLKFKTLDGIVNDNNYDNASPQAEHSFEYTDSKKKVKMEWKTNKDKQIHKRGAENVYKISLVLKVLVSL